MFKRRFPIGVELDRNKAHFRVWAPDQRTLSVVTDSAQRVRLERDNDGYYAGWIDGLADGGRYRLELDDSTLVPDPASRFQPDGPHGPSQIVDPARFEWTDAAWKGRPIDEYVIYELHIGTFTKEGTWAAATRELAELAATGITCIEVMPVAEFTGEFGWGYDGVDLFAPTRLYGPPDDFRQFVNIAHRHGICVMLDVVYNHLGPDGNYLTKLARAYFTDRYQTEWGEPLNFDGPESAPVREFFSTNAAYWIQEFHLDGLRLDATQAIFDAAPPAKHIITQIAQQARDAAPQRTIVIVAENEPQNSDLGRPVSERGYGLDALWNDDFHHSAIVALIGKREAYYTDYRGDPQEFVSAAKYGYLYQGQWYSWQKNRRGQPGLGLPSTSFVSFLQNHDQIANGGGGRRIHGLSSPGRYRAFLALCLLGPGTPMLFQGQEFAASTPFLYFADHQKELAKLVNQGRRDFLAQFPSQRDPHLAAMMALPDDPQTFKRCKLDFSERKSHAAQYELTKALLRIRHHDPAFRHQQRLGLDGAVLGPQALLLRYFLEDGADRLLIVNWGRDLDWDTAPEPLLAPPLGSQWKLELSTDDPRYGGLGTSPVETEDRGWHFPAEAAFYFTSTNKTENQTL